MSKYNHQEIEQKWQKFWEQNKTFAATTGSDKQKYYALDMFPYPSGAGLHVGHPEGYTATDIICRKKRHQGFEVLHPMGWDAFGLPAENYALKTGVHPAASTAENIKTFKRQIQSLGFSYDWEREFATTDEGYYKWTQWIFLQLFKKDLAYEKEMAMNWCPECRVVAANEEVEQGTHERCGTPVERKNLRQWMFGITKYADRLLDDLDTLQEWPEAIKTQQRNWIGKSVGAEVNFDLEGEKVQVFTTRPDTLFGATYFVLSPEHPRVKEITTDEQRAEVEDCIKKYVNTSAVEREKQEMFGAFTGAYALNPVNGEKIPVWITSYVMMGYGTGSIMAVPAHDKRDFEFRKKMNVLGKGPQIEIKYVLHSATWSWRKGKYIKSDKFIPGWDNEVNDLFEGFDITKEDTEANEILTKHLEDLGICYESSYGKMINSEELTGLWVEDATEKIIERLEKEGIGKKKVNFKLQDWIFTRQRFWGEPIPLVFDTDGKVHGLDDSELPLILPEIDDYHPTADGEPPLARAEDWVNVKGYFTSEGTVKTLKKGESAPEGVEIQEFKRETSTMPNWAGSSWYWLRYMDASNEQEFCSKEADKYWGSVDLYVGGTEHAVLHLLYARFWHKVLYDLGLTHTVEPFKKLVNQGLILGSDGEKMSKSRGNVVNPDEIVAEFGADTLRIYEMFMGPFEQAKPWATDAVGGMRKFLDKVWRTFNEKEMIEGCPLPAFRKIVGQTIKKVEEDIDDFKFNTALSQLMIFFNEAQKETKVSRGSMKKICILLSPFAPHLAEEIWSTVFEEKESIAYAPWPTYDPKFLVDDTVNYAVQVNGKLRGDFQLPKDASKEEAIAMAKGLEKVQKYLNEGEIKKEIFVPGKIVGFVVK